MSASWRAAFKTAVIAVETIIGAALLVGIFYSAFFSHAQQPDPLGSVGPTVFPFPAPSIDTTARTFVMNGERYDIPGNFLPSGDKQIDGSSRAISVRALLPEIVGITRETSECFERTKYVPGQGCYDRTTKRPARRVGLTGVAKHKANCFCRKICGAMWS